MADELLAKISEKIAGYENEMVEFSKTLIGIPAISPKEGGKGESQKAAYIENILRQWGFDDITHFDAPDETALGGKRPNFVVRMKGKDSSRTLWLVAHMDIVPPGDLKK
jgi:succinyl-diaminopimelate desuccinylase